MNSALCLLHLLETSMRFLRCGGFQLETQPDSIVVLASDHPFSLWFIDFFDDFLAERLILQSLVLPRCCVIG